MLHAALALVAALSLFVLDMSSDATQAPAEPAPVSTVEVAAEGHDH